MFENEIKVSLVFAISHLNLTGKENYFTRSLQIGLSSQRKSYWNFGTANRRALRVGLISNQRYKLFLVTFSLAYLSCTDWNQWRESNSWYWSSNFKMYATPAREVYINFTRSKISLEIRYQNVQCFTMEHANKPKLILIRFFSLPFLAPITFCSLYLSDRRKKYGANYVLRLENGTLNDFRCNGPFNHQFCTKNISLF